MEAVNFHDGIHFADSYFDQIVDYETQMITVGISLVEDLGKLSGLMNYKNAEKKIAYFKK